MKKSKIILLCVCMCIFCIVPTKEVRAEQLNELSREDYDSVRQLVKEKLESGEIQSSEDISEIFDIAEDEYGIEISDSEKNKAIQMYDTAKDLGIDNEKILDVVDDVYSNVIEGKEYSSTDEMINAVSEQLIDSAADTVKETVKNGIISKFWEYVNLFKERISEFIDTISELWKK